MQLPIIGVKQIALAVVVSLTVGFGIGYYTKAQFDKADLLDSAVEARHDTAVGIKESMNISADTESKAAKSSANNDGIRNAVAAHFKEKTNDKEETRIIYLDNWTVRMLDSARIGAAFDATTVSDVEGKTTSDVTLQEFLDNDLAIVGICKDLAIRHDTLVDYINALIQKQAE